MHINEIDSNFNIDTNTKQSKQWNELQTYMTAVFA